MEKRSVLKKLLIAGAALLFAGAAIFVIGMSAAKWDTDALSTVSCEQKSYTAQGDVHSVSVSFSSADIRVAADEAADAVTVSYPLRHNLITETAAVVTVTEKDGTLTIAESDFSFSFGWETKTPAVTVTLPARTFTLLKLSAKSGDVSVNGAHADTADISSQNGTLSLDGVTARELHIATQNGNIGMNDVRAETIDVSADLGDIRLTGRLSATRAQFCSGMGDIALDTVDAQETQIVCDMGNISARFAGALANYTVLCTSRSGNAPVFPSADGERKIEATTDMGNIEILFEN